VSAQGVEAQLAAVDSIGAAVGSFARQAGPLADQASSAARDFESRVEDEYVRRVDALKKARQTKEAAAQALRNCTENCGGLERALAAADKEVDRATKRADASAKALAQVGEAMRAFAIARRSFLTALEDHAPRAEASTQDLSAQLRQYLGSGAESQGAPSRGGRGSSDSKDGSGTPSSGIQRVDLSQIENDRQETMSYDKVSREHVASGLNRLKTVVEPAVAMGKGPDYFKARDAAEGLSGEHSYSGVHNWFYNSDHAIKLSQTDSGRYTVTNGYHRLAVARELGIDSLPAVVR
jgi:hypothetical protein